MRFQRYRDSCGQGLNFTRPYSSRGFAGLTKTTSNRGMKYSCGDKFRQLCRLFGFKTETLACVASVLCGFGAKNEERESMTARKMG